VKVYTPNVIPFTTDDVGDGVPVETTTSLFTDDL
jgi:hypothetical protein